MTEAAPASADRRRDGTIAGGVVLIAALPAHARALERLSLGRPPHGRGKPGAAELRRAATVIDGEDPRPRYNCALLRAAAGHPEQAASDLRELLQRSPGYEPARRALGLAP